MYLMFGMFCTSLNNVIIQILSCPALVFFLRFMLNNKHLYAESGALKTRQRYITIIVARARG